MKKLFSALVSAAVTASALFSSLTVGVFASSVGPQADGSFVMPDGMVYTAEQINDSEVQPILSVSQISYDYSEVPVDNIVAVTISVDGAEGEWCAAGIHLYYDERLTPVLNEYGDVKKEWGEATDLLFEYGTVQTMTGTDCIFFATASSGDYGLDGDIITYYFYLPGDYHPGAVYSLDLCYVEDDCFTNNADDEKGLLMQAYAFINMQDGYIAINEDPTGQDTTEEPTEPPTEEDTTNPTADDIPTIIPSNLTMNIGDTNELLVANVPEGSVVAWTSENTTIATVSNGIVTAKNPGKTNIYAICNGTVMTCNVIVVDSPTLAYNLGDVDQSGSVDSSDASNILAEYANIATGGTAKLTNEQFLAADVNKDNALDSSDASSVLAYYAFIATGGKGTIMDYLSR